MRQEKRSRGEPGAGVVAAAENTVATYDNLSDWNVATSSSGQ